MKKMLDLIAANKLVETRKYLVDEIHKLDAAGADFAIMASNTPHIVFNEILKKSPLPMISIVDAACQRTKVMGLERVGLFGTKFTMQGGFYNKTFSEQDIEVIVPDEQDQDYIHEKYMGELVRGIILDETRKGLIRIMDTMQKSKGIQGLILGGTELPLILTENENYGIPFLDTTKIHVVKILEKLV
jgi:aspartate racemase